LLNKDFYHLSSGTIEVKSNTPNNVAFKVTGKSSHEKATSGTVSRAHRTINRHRSGVQPSFAPVELSCALVEKDDTKING
jgi:hypothetical protein